MGGNTPNHQQTHTINGHKYTNNRIPSIRINLYNKYFNNLFINTCRHKYMDKTEIKYNKRGVFVVKCPCPCVCPCWYC